MIYKITNKTTGDFYIGKSVDPQLRFYKHLKNAFDYGNDTYLYRAMRKHGAHNFELSIIEECSIELDSDKEKEWIAKLNPKYNMTPGGDGGDTSKSPNYVEAIKRRDQRGEKNGMFGKSAFKGRKHTDEARLKQSIGLTEAWAKCDRKARGVKIAGSKNGMFGKTPKNAQKIEFNGVKYESLARASRETGYSSKYLKENGTLYDE
jgi:group I intron endonuclease